MTKTKHTRSTEESARSNYAVAREIGAAITSSLVLEDVMQNVAQRIAQALDVWECDLYEYDSESDTLVASATWAPEMTQADLDWIGTVVNLSERPRYQEMVRCRAVIEDHIDDPDIDPIDCELMEQWGEKASLAVTLVHKDRPIGCLVLIEKRTVRRFSDADKELVSLLSVPAAVAVHNARLFHRREEQNRQLDSLFDSSQTLNSTVVLGDVLALVVRKATEVLGCTYSILYEYDPVADTETSLAFYGRPGADDDQEPIGTVFPLADYPDERVIIQNRVVVEERLSDPELSAPARASMAKWQEKTCLNVPLIYGDEVLGLLILVETDRERHFTPGEVDLVRGLGEQAAVAIRHASLFETQERQNKRLVTLLDTSRALAASLDTQGALARTRTEIAALLTLSSADVTLLVRTGDDRYLPYEVALDDSAGGGFDTEAVPGESGTLDDAADSSGDGLDDLQRRAVEELTMVQQADSGGTRLVLPLRSRQGCEGLVAAPRPDGDVVADDVLALAQILANQAAVAVENGRLYRQIERQATSDGLTGLYNHRYFYERLHQEFARAQRYGLPLSLLMLDIDDFKSFNDAYGHPVGDQVLVKVADVMRRQLRRNVDFAARYGGEEFAVLLPNTPAEGAQVVGDRLQRQLAALSHGARAVPPARLDGAFLVGERIRHSVEVTPLDESAGAQEVHVTVSCGIAAYPDTASGPDEVVRNADKALYLAKRLGKNRVELFTVR